ncbi:MAG TPA: serine/threonine-protein kinase, partial [Polyangiales bacterium]
MAGDGESGEHDRHSRATRRVGSLLLGRFELHELIGVGAFGEVYRAHDRLHPKLALAVKVLSRPSPHALYQFKREFRSLSAWSHPNLVALHELFLDEELAFFTMELVPGVDFLRYVRPLGVLDAKRLLHALRGLVDGVSALHAHGYVHRDLKPSNVLVDADGRVVIVDLGLARLFEPGDADRSEHGFTGTVGYAAPEQLALEQVGPEADWYAIGTMLYEALSGALPYDGSFAEIARQKRGAAAPLARMDGPLEALGPVCQALLAPVPAQRAGAQLLRSALGQPAHAARSSGPALVGRGAELARLRDVFEQVERGASRVVVVEGSSGLGKTTLVEHFLSELRAQHRAIVLAGRCYVN